MEMWIPIIVAVLALVKVVLGMWKNHKNVVTIITLVDKLEEIFEGMSQYNARYWKDSIKEEATDKGVENLLNKVVNRSTV